MAQKFPSVLIGILLLAGGFVLGLGSASRGWAAQPRSPVPRTGQAKTFVAGDDQALGRGVVWPTPRFADGHDGTVTDKLTGLVWLKDASCFGLQPWKNALSSVNDLAAPACGLSDGSSAGAWRLPNIRELESLIDYGVVDPAVSDTAGTGQWATGNPFNGLQPGLYWSGTTSAYRSELAWTIYVVDGYANYDDKRGGGYAWPVRDGQPVHPGN